LIPEFYFNIVTHKVKLMQQTIKIKDQEQVVLKFSKTTNLLFLSLLKSVIKNYKTI